MIHDVVKCRQVLPLMTSAVLLILMSLNSATANADVPPATPSGRLAGKFSDNKLTVELSESGGGYVGTLSMGGDKFPAKATAAGEGLTGTFTASGSRFDFTAKMAGDKMILVSGGETYTLARVVTNPLASRQAAPPAGDAPRLPERLVIRPQMLFDPVTGKDAYSVFVPDKWKLQGQVTWPPAGAPLANYDMSVSDPAQRAAWRHFPRINYVAGLREARIRQAPAMRARWESQWAEGNLTPLGFEVRKLPATPSEYVEKILIPKFLPEVATAKDVNVVSETDMPDYARAQAEKDPFHRQIHTSRFRITYTTPDGPVEREFISNLIVDKTTQDGTTAWIGDVTTCRAPKGKLDALLPTFATIESSVAIQLPWFNALYQVNEQYREHQQEINAKMLADQAHAIEVQMGIMRDYAKASSDLVSERIRTNFAEQQAAKAATQRQFIHYINNTASFGNPNDGSTVTLSSSYKYQYINNHNEVIQTNDPTYSPPIDPGTSWKQMEQVR